MGRPRGWHAPPPRGWPESAHDEQAPVEAAAAARTGPAGAADGGAFAPRPLGVAAEAAASFWAAVDSDTEARFAAASAGATGAARGVAGCAPGAAARRLGGGVGG